jgi:hypothetical protein
LLCLAGVLGIRIAIDERLKGYVSNVKAVALNGRHGPIEQHFVRMLRANLGKGPFDTRRQPAQQRGHQDENLPRAMHAAQQHYRNGKTPSPVQFTVLLVVSGGALLSWRNRGLFSSTIFTRC